MKNPILILLLIIPIISIGQSKLREADELFADNKYLSAIETYHSALKETSGHDVKCKIFFSIAECYRKANYYEHAISWYRDAIDNGYTDILAKINYSKMLLATCKYEEAMKSAESTLIKAPNDSVALFVSSRCKYAMEHKDDPDFNPVTNEAELNSQWSEYGLGWLDGAVCFASMRRDSSARKMDERTIQGFSDLYQASISTVTGEWINTEKLRGGVNTFDYNDGTFAFDPDRNQIYVMHCDGPNENCNIYVCTNNNGKWSHAKNFYLYSDKYSIGHPALAQNGSRLYFVSDMPGGLGGRDIWYIQRVSDGSWGNPINLGYPVNTSADEMFPYILEDSLLFFSSDGHLGMGGLDIFCTTLTGTAFRKPFNLGVPYNSGADDFSILLSNRSSGGFLCSNRPGGRGSDDIYSFDKFPFMLTARGNVTDLSSGEPIVSATIVIRNTDGDSVLIYTDEAGNYIFNPEQNTQYEVAASSAGYLSMQKNLETSVPEYIYEFSNRTGYDLDFKLAKDIPAIAKISGLVLDNKNRKTLVNEYVYLYKDGDLTSVTLTDSTGKYYFPGLKKETSYTVRVSPNGYFAGSRNCETGTFNREQIFSKETGHNMDFYLDPIIKDKEIVINNIYYEFDKATLFDSSKIELNKIVNLMNENPGICIELSSHTDTRGSDEYNRKLSERRAQSCVAYLVYKGIDRNRLIARGYGKSMPLIVNAQTEEEHLQNRRTAFKVIKIDQTKQAFKRNNNSKFFKVQIMASTVKPDSENGFEDIVSIFEDYSVSSDFRGDGYYRFYVGPCGTLEEASKLSDGLKSIGYKDCFIVTFNDN